MARKHGNKTTGTKSRPRAFNPKEGKLKRWEKPSDIPLDEEDRFHTSRDQILLNGEDDDYIDEGDEDEVFALKGLAEDSSESEEEDDEGSNGNSGASDDIETLPKKSPKLKTKSKKSKPSPPSSQASESEEEEEVWGKKKSDYYSSNAAQLESDDEEANELEEQEARRLQSKVRETMVEDDFGLDDAVEDAVEPDDDLIESLLPVVESLPRDKQALLKHIEKTSPEALALARDWDDTAQGLFKYQSKIAALEAADPDALSLGMVHLHYQALLTYATTLAFYIHLRSSEKYASRPDLLQKHPIMSRLLTLKQSLSTLEELDFAASDSDDDEDADAFDLWKMDKVHGLDWDELAELLADADDVLEDLGPRTRSRDKHASEPEPKLTIKIKGKGKAAAETSEQADEPLKKKRKKSKSKTESTSSISSLPVFDLVEPTFSSSSAPTSKSKTTRSSSSSSVPYDPYGEHLTLQQPDAQDKESRKRTLRFHTSKIESSSAKREKARQGMGGDDDIPWKERKKAKEDRLAKEAAKKRGLGGDDLDDAEPDALDASEESRKKRKRGEEDEGGESDGEGDGAGGYYELVKQKSKEKKEKKKAEYEAVQSAIRSQYDEESTTDGPRSLTRAILANKGLTPHRSKSVRNPRVKKRQRFEKAKKKVASQKAVYKGGVSDTAGRYEGEKTGISKVIKSVRL